MKNGRYQSLNPKEVLEYRKKQIEKERARRPLYGLGRHPK